MIRISFFFFLGKGEGKGGRGEGGRRLYSCKGLDPQSSIHARLKGVVQR